MFTRLRRSWLVVPALLAVTFLALGQAGASGQPIQAAAPSVGVAGHAAPVTAPHGGAATAAASGKKTPVQPAFKLVTHVTQDGVNMRACPSTSCAIVATVNMSHTVDSWCWRSGQFIIDTVYWDLVYDVTNGFGGFITEHYLANKSQGDVC